MAETATIPPFFPTKSLFFGLYSRPWQISPPAVGQVILSGTLKYWLSTGGDWDTRITFTWAHRVGVRAKVWVINGEHVLQWQLSCCLIHINWLRSRFYLSTLNYIHSMFFVEYHLFRIYKLTYNKYFTFQILVNIWQNQF